MNKEQLWKEWGYPFSEWIKVLQSAPVDMIISKDYSESYSLNRAHVFKLESGQFAFILERGCSCYTYSDAQITLFPNKADALDTFSKWIVERERYKMQYD